MAAVSSATASSISSFSWCWRLVCRDVVVLRGGLHRGGVLRARVRTRAGVDVDARVWLRRGGSLRGGVDDDVLGGSDGVPFRFRTRTGDFHLPWRRLIRRRGYGDDRLGDRRRRFTGVETRARLWRIFRRVFGQGERRVRQGAGGAQGRPREDRRCSHRADRRANRRDDRRANRRDDRRDDRRRDIVWIWRVFGGGVDDECLWLGGEIFARGARESFRRRRRVESLRRILLRGGGNLDNRLVRLCVHNPRQIDGVRWIRCGGGDGCGFFAGGDAVGVRRIKLGIRVRSAVHLGCRVEARVAVRIDGERRGVGVFRVWKFWTRRRVERGGDVIGRGGRGKSFREGSRRRVRNARRCRREDGVVANRQSVRRRRGGTGERSGSEYRGAFGAASRGVRSGEYRGRSGGEYWKALERRAPDRRLGRRAPDRRSAQLRDLRSAQPLVRWRSFYGIGVRRSFYGIGVRRSFYGIGVRLPRPPRSVAAAAAGV